MENNRKIMEKSPACSGNTRKGTVCRDISWEITVIFVLLLLFIGGTVSVFCDQKWQGNAAMIRKGAFDSPGMYAASNSFPINSKIQVRNLRNNRALQVIVVQRIPETMNVFLLLSEDSARQLGMGENDVINVEVSVISFGTGDVIGLPDDLPYNPDLDVYPYVTDVPGLTPYATMAPTPEAIPEATAAFMPEPTVTPEPGTTAAPTPAITPEVSPESTPFPGETAEPETASESVGREPQKNLFLPPHEDEAYTLDEVTRPDEEIDSDEIAYQPADADIDIKDEETGESSLESPVRTDEELEVATVDSPDVENPTVEDKKSAGKKEEALVVAEADLPRVPEKESSVPDPSTDVPEKRETDIAFVQEEPVPPEQSGKEPPDPTEEMPRAGEKEIALTEKEPDVPQKEKSVPDPTHETPTVDEEKDIA
ncbi:MAG: hypothetical protein JW881_16505, partial [Spirochaetales bacterium]|nr:hypothetical protein [Spirochaetales bacterium]